MTEREDYLLNLRGWSENNGIKERTCRKKIDFKIISREFKFFLDWSDCETIKAVINRRKLYSLLGKKFR